MVGRLNAQQTSAALGRAAREGRVTDAVLLACVLLSGGLWLAEATGPARTVSTAVALCVAPGWALLRVSGARPSAWTALLAIAISCSLAVATGVLLVTRLDWNWAAGVNVINMLTVLALSFALARDRAS